MAPLSDDAQKIIRDQMSRAARRLDGAAVAMSREMSALTTMRLQETLQVITV